MDIDPMEIDPGDIHFEMMDREEKKEKNMRIVSAEVTVKIKIEIMDEKIKDEDAIHDVISEMDYDMKYEDKLKRIVETEIVDTRPSYLI